MVVQRAIVIINEMPMGGAIRMHVRGDMTVRVAVVERVVIRITVIVVAVFSTCALRGGHKRALKGKRHRRRHHDDDSEPLQQSVRQTAQP
jgi:hypothetical protein